MYSLCRLCRGARPYKIALRTLAGIWVALCILLLAQPGQAQPFATFTVDKVKGAGDALVGVAIKPFVPEPTKVAVAKADQPKDVAANIAKALGGNVKVNATDPNKVELQLQPGQPSTSIFGVQSDAISYTEDYEKRVAFLPLPGTPLADFAFLSNPVNGQSSLISDATITAGFTNGLLPVSFTAEAGTDLSMLASTLNSALSTAGYATSMPDSTDVIISALGAGLPVEVDFSIESVGSVGDRGIETALFGFAVPEPASVTLLSIGIGMLGVSGAVMRRRRPG
jgi:hypothetical protein